MEVDSIKVLSLNAKGLNTPEEWRMLLHDLKSSCVDVAFIQEMHFLSDRLPFLQNSYFPWTYHSTNPTSESKGVSILLSIKLPWHCQAVLGNPERRFVFLKGLVGEVQLTLATLYAPNDHQDRFLKHTLDGLLEFREGQLILGGGL